VPRGKKIFRLPSFASPALYLLMKGLILCVRACSLICRQNSNTLMYK